MTADTWDVLKDAAEKVAPRLLGSLLIMDVPHREENHDSAGQPSRQMIGKIVETEAYSQTDAASHSYRGQTPRTEIMFGPAGFLYVYFTYGMHYCCNIVTGATGEGSAVLIRALEPVSGEELMAQNRVGRSGIELTNGPAKLCQAFAIDKKYNRHDLRQAPLRLELQPAVAADQIVHTTRIGISEAKEKPWRFYIRGNPYVSKL